MFQLKPERAEKPEPPRRPKREPSHYISHKVTVGPVCTCIALRFPHFPKEHYSLKAISWDGDWRHFWSFENRANFSGFRKYT
jgi:hypothetical protein